MTWRPSSAGNTCQKNVYAIEGWRSARCVRGNATRGEVLRDTSIRVGCDASEGGSRLAEGDTSAGAIEVDGGRADLLADECLGVRDEGTERPGSAAVSDLSGSCNQLSVSKTKSDDRKAASWQRASFAIVTNPSRATS